MSDRFYITTPIYYPNAEPHLGHVYTTLCADTIARYRRLVGDDTFFLTVTDDDFIRTTSDRHKQGVGVIVEKLVRNGDIYLGDYEGWYDEGQEEFVTETEAKTNEHKSAVTGKPLVRYKEPTYFFRLKKYTAR